MRNMNLTPRPRDLTMLLNSDRTEPADTGRPESVETGIPKNRRTVKPNDAEGWVKTSVEPARLDPTQAQDLGRRA